MASTIQSQENIADLPSLNSTVSDPLRLSRMSISSTTSVAIQPESQQRDFLSTLAPELLVEVLSEVPLSSFLDLKQTSTFFRSFLKDNASTICNRAIRTRFPYEAKLLESALDDGWLVPTHPCYKSFENQVRKEKNKSFVFYYQIARMNSFRETVVLPSGPGPQYLRLLEYDQDLNRKGDRRVLYGNGEEHWQVHQLLGDLFDIMININQMGCLVKNNALRVEKFPREVLWYYGVDDLRAWSVAQSSRTRKVTTKDDPPKVLTKTRPRPKVLARLWKRLLRLCKREKR